MGQHRQSLLRIAAVALLLATLTNVPAPAQAVAAQAFPGAIVGVASGRCIDVPGGATADGTALILWDCHGNANQVWTRQADATVRNRGKCLAVNGSTAVIATCGSDASQRWTYDIAAETLQNQSTGTCLDAYGGGTANNTRLIVWACHGNPNQQWLVSAAGLTPILNVSFSGTFTGATTYTPSTGEHVDGQLTRLAGSETINGSEVTLTGSGTGIGFTPRVPVTSTKYVDKNLLSEALVRRQGGATLNFDTVLSLAGGVYYRYKNGSQNTTQFGMYGPDAPYYDTRQDGPHLSDTRFTHVALAYEYVSDSSARLTAFVDGCQIGTTITTPVAAANASQGLIAFGNDAGTRDRGWHGSLDAVALASHSGSASPVDFQLDAPACGGSPAPPGCEGDPGSSGPVPAANVIAVERCDTLNRILEKSSHVVPTQAQLTWQQRELTAFLHYGMNTFTNVEWGSGSESPAQYNPSDVNPAQWMEVLRRNGLKQVILTVKHHDGFLLYPTRYSPHSVKSSPWWTRNPGPGGVNPEGDVFREVVDAARAAGLAVGFYLSPADGAEVPGRRGNDRFGNGSARRNVSIPTPVPGDDRNPSQTYTYAADDYNAYFLNQLYELLTEYGPMAEVWFDGANPYSQWPQPYQVGDWYDLIRKLQPGATIAINGPDVRWIGSESGAFRADEWSTLPFDGDPGARNRDDDMLGGASATDLGSSTLIQRHLGDITYLSWYPAEADVSIRPGWFWHSSQNGSVKQPAKLMELYENAVGRNANLLLNVPPNTAGVIDAPDVASLDGFGSQVRARYGNELLAKAGASGTHLQLTDDALGTFWTPGSGTTGSVELVACRPRVFDRVLLQEAVGNGQRVEAFAVDAWVNGSWQQVASAGTIGYKRIVALTSVTTDRVRVRITDARGVPRLASVKAYSTNPSANPNPC